MYLILSLHCDNPESDVPRTAILALGPDQARSLLVLARAGQQIRGDLAKAGMVSEPYPVSFGIGEKIPAFRVKTLTSSAAVLDADYANPIEMDVEVGILPESYDPDTMADESAACAEPVSVESIRVWIRSHGLNFSACSRHGSDRFTTGDISFEVLEAIANGTDPGLPMVVPAVCVTPLEKLVAESVGNVAESDTVLDDLVVELAQSAKGVRAANETSDPFIQDSAIAEAEALGSEINNRGLRGQLAFILEMAKGDAERLVLAALSDAATANAK